MAQRLRVFISSPGDVRDAREIAAQTVEKLAEDYLRHFSLEPYMWENEALLASGHFQDAIEPPSQFDIVTLVLWSRLGTPLPIKTEVRSYVGIDGRAPVTGTEWEYEDALRAARERGVPELLVYRNCRPAPVNVVDAVSRQDAVDQMTALDRFWTRHFADRGTFLGAYRQFERLEDFAKHLEHDLRRLLDRRVVGLAERPRERLWPGSPFRGLDAFDVEHAPIFFGRAAESGRAVGQLIDNAGHGSAFLLVCGASGSGKSSLVRAGVLPRLALPRRVVGLSFMRRILFRPGDMRDGEDVFDALARVVVASPGEGIGLPELGRPERLAAVMRDAPTHAPAFIEAALDTLTKDGRSAERLLEGEDAAAVLVIDQLEELFSDRRITPEQRRGFAALTAALARHGRIWVIATLRADLWHRISETPELIALSEGHGRFDLLPPAPAQIGQMIRLGADAAGLSYEAGQQDRIPLGDRIAEEAAHSPSALPLLSYLLEQLYEADAVRAGGAALTYATYERLGRLAGSIATRAEAILQEQAAETRDALPSVLFRLVEVTRDADGTTQSGGRRAPLQAFGEGPARDLVDAFLAADARLLVAETAADGEPVVRLAHEALLREWGRARALIDADARLMATRRMVEERHARWSELGRRNDSLLAGADLAEGLLLLSERRGELASSLVSYIDASERRQRARRLRTLAMACAATAVVVGLVGAAAVAAFVAQLSRTRTEELKLVRAAIDDQRDGDDAFRVHDYGRATHLYGRAVGESQQLVRLEPNDAQLRVNLASTQASLGYVYLRRNASSDVATSRAAFAAAASTLAAAAKLAKPSSALAGQIVTFRRQLAPYLAR